MLLCIICAAVSQLPSRKNLVWKKMKCIKIGKFLATSVLNLLEERILVSREIYENLGGVPKIAFWGKNQFSWP